MMMMKSGYDFEKKYMKVRENYRIIFYLKF